MLKNYLKTAIRNLRRHKGYSFLNIAGLAIGMACCILILLWVKDELSYDRYHKNADQLYRVVVKGKISNRDINFSTSPAPLAKALVDEFPEVLQATRFLSHRNVLVSYQEKHFNENLMLYVDANFFDVFSIPLIKGDSQEVLLQPNSVLRGVVKTRTKSSRFRSRLVVFQFSISIVMLIGTFVVKNQLEYIRNKKLGFEKEQLLVIQRAENLGQNKEAFRNELLVSYDVINVVFSNSVPGRHLGDFAHLAEGASADEMVRMFLLYGDFNFFDTLKMEMIKGRYFSKDRPADKNSVILNETAAAALGMENPVGKRLIRSSLSKEGTEFFTIIDIVKDFHYESLIKKSDPWHCISFPRMRQDMCPSGSARGVSLKRWLS